MWDENVIVKPQQMTQIIADKTFYENGVELQS